MNNVLCPVDFSDASLNAVEFAANISAANQSGLRLLYVFNEEEFNKIINTKAAEYSFKQLMALAEKRLSAICDETKKAKNSKTLKKCDYEVRLGSLTSTIVNYADEGNYQLIVMGTNGVSNVPEALVGSNTINVIGKAGCPVLCVPKNADFKGFKNIVFATDFQEEDKLAIQQVVAFATLYNSRIHVLHVSHSNKLLEKATYEDFIQELKSFIQYNKVTYDNKVYKEEVSRGIEEYLNEKNADLLVVLRKNRSFFEKLLHRSITKRLSYLTDHPLLAIKL